MVMDSKSPSDYRLLQERDPPAFELVNPDGASPIVLVADHAGFVIPAALGNLGVRDEDRRKHIAGDIGIAGVGRALARLLDAPLVLGNYSRLVIDCNRRLDDPTSMPEQSDGIPIPGNGGLSAEQRQARIDEIFWPYHHAIARILDTRLQKGILPVFISLHSFTPEMQGFRRPWHIGILWDRDERLPVPLIDALAQDPQICVGDNQPYSGRDAHGFTVGHHAEPRGMANVTIELRQDLIKETASGQAWANRLAPLFCTIAARPECQLQRSPAMAASVM